MQNRRTPTVNDSKGDAIRRAAFAAAVAAVVVVVTSRWPASPSESDIVANDVRCVLCGPARADLGQFRISERAYLMRFASIFAMRDCALRRMRRHLAIVEADCGLYELG